MACLFALEQPVVSLGCKYTLVLKTGQPELSKPASWNWWSTLVVRTKWFLSFIMAYKSLYSFTAGMSYLL